MSNEGSGSAEERSAPLLLCAQKFEEEFPYYLVMGMTYDQYWNGDCALARAYRKAFKLKQDLRNQDLWLEGMYIYEALCDVSPAMRSMGAKKPSPYRTEPFELKPIKKEIRLDEPQKQPLTKEEKSDNKARKWMEILAVEWNTRFEKGEVGEKHG